MKMEELVAGVQLPYPRVISWEKHDIARQRCAVKQVFSVVESVGNKILEKQKEEGWNYLF